MFALMALLGCHHHSPTATPDLLRRAAAFAPDAPRLVPQVAGAPGPLIFAVSPDGREAISVGAEGLGALWDLDTGAVLGHVPVDLSGAVQLTWTDAGVLMRTEDGDLRLFQPTGTEAPVRVHGEALPAPSPALAAPGDLIVGATSGGALPDGGALVGFPDGHALVLREAVEPVVLAASAPPVARIAAGGQRLLMPGAGDSLTLWDLGHGRVARAWVVAGLVADALSEDGVWAAIAQADGAVRRWEVDRAPGPGEPLATEARPAASLALAKDGTLLVGTADGHAKVYGPTGDLVQDVRVALGGAVLVALSRDGRSAVAAGATGELRRFDPQTGKKLEGSLNPGIRARSVILSRDGQTAYMGGDAGREKGGIWRLDGRRLRPVDAATARAPVLALEMLPKGQDGIDHLAVSTLDGQVCEIPASGPPLPNPCAEGPLDLYSGLAALPGPRPLIVGGAVSGLAQVWVDREWHATLAADATPASEAAPREPLWAVADATGRYDASWSGEVDFVHEVRPGEAPRALWQTRGAYAPGLLGEALQGRAHASSTPKPAPEIVPLGALLLPTDGGPLQGQVCAVDRGGGLGAAHLWLNGWAQGAPTAGEPCKTAADGADAGTGFGFSIPAADLRAETNRVSVAVDNADGSRQSAPTVLRVLPPQTAKGTLVLPATAPAAPRGVVAVVVGISNYPNNALSWPAADAERVGEAIGVGAQTAWPDLKPEVRTLTSEGGQAGVTKTQILTAISDAARGAPEGSVLVLFLSGHGASKDGTWYFLTGDATSTDLARITAEDTVSSDELAGKVKGTHARRVVLILDTCASGVAADDLASLANRADLYVLSASGDAASYESQQIQHGLLTWSLLDVLSQPGALPTGLWDVDLVLPLASQRVVWLGDALGLTLPGLPVVARPRLDRHVEVGRTPTDGSFRQKLQLVDPVARVNAPALIDQDSGVDSADLSVALGMALAPDANLVPSGGTWRVGGTYADTREGRCIDLHVTEGSTPRGERTLCGEEAALMTEAATWIRACVSQGACPAEPAP